MKRFFLVDIENVGKSFLNGIDRLTVEDTLIICNNTIAHKEFSPAILDGLTRTKATIRKFYIHNACKNAMDFELVIELGFLIAENGNHAQYYVVSNDKGFDVVNDYIKNKGLKTIVKRISSLDVYFKEEEDKKTMEEEIQEIMKTYPEKTTKLVLKGIQQSSNLTELHTFLQKHQCQTVYGIIKPIYLQKFSGA